MKKILLLLTLCCLLTGCGPSPAPVSSPEPQGTKPLPTETEAPETAPVFKEIQVLPTEAPELSYDAYQVVYNILTDAGSESGQFQGIGPEGSLLWTYETEHFPQAQMEQIIPVGQWQDRYYLIEGGTVKALNIADGTVLFSNSEFGGVPCREAMVLDDYGYLYLAGYDGPDFFAMDPEGRTVKKIPDLSETYMRPTRITLEDDSLTVYMESDSMGNTGDFPCPVEIDWLPGAMG